MASKSSSNDELKREMDPHKADDTDGFVLPRSKSFDAHGFPIVPKRPTHSRVEEAVEYNQQKEVGFACYACCYSDIFFSC